MIATSGYRRPIAGHAHLAPPSPRRRAFATSVRPMAKLSPQPSVRHRPGRPVRRQFGRRQLRRRGATFRTSARPQPRFPTTSIRPNATTSIRPLTRGRCRAAKAPHKGIPLWICLWHLTRALSGTSLARYRGSRGQYTSSEPDLIERYVPKRRDCSIWRIQSRSAR